MDITILRKLRTKRAHVAACSPNGGGACDPPLGAWGEVTNEGEALAPLEAGERVIVQLDDGVKVRLREARGDDGEPLRRMYLRLSHQSRYLYFCAGVPANETWADRFATLGCADGKTSYTLVAEPGDPPDGDREIVGLARFARSAQGQSADIGILLADSWQSRGLGGFVLDRLRLEARRRAVVVFTGSVLWENRRMLRLARRLFPYLELDCSQGVCDLTITLDNSNVHKGESGSQ
jgi:acetyltransferase